MSKYEQLICGWGFLILSELTELNGREGLGLLLLVIGFITLCCWAYGND